MKNPYSPEKDNFQLRPLPYPYRAMLSICSDLDQTPDRKTYWEITRFLNTAAETKIGPGLGLEVGNTIYFDMPDQQFSYWNTDDVGREMIRTLIRSGHIDCIHSYGELTSTREEVARTLQELDRHNCRLNVWIDHGTAVTNFGTDIMKGHGDEPFHEAYHADLTTAQGVNYVWRGRVTSVLGQEIAADLLGIWNPVHPIASARTLLKETAKCFLGCANHEKYRMHKDNQVISNNYLRDGTPVYEFIRCNPHWAGVSVAETGRRIGEILTDRMLTRLVDREGVCVLYTHLGKAVSSEDPFDNNSIAGFVRLATASREGKILVTTTRRALGYVRAIRETSFESTHDENGIRIDLNTRTVPRHAGTIERKDLDGMTFYVSKPETARVFINSHEVKTLRRNPPDHTGRQSISLPWRPLEFPDL